MKLRKYLCEVEGEGLFPVDMFRYDSCYPKTEQDSVKVFVRSRRTVQVVAVSPESDPLKVLTEARWRSFGWKVLSVEREV